MPHAEREALRWSSVHQASARELEEDVFEGRLPMQRVLDCDSGPLDPPGHRFRVRRELQDLRAYVLVYKGAWGAFGDEPTALHDAQAVAQLRRLVHVMGCEHEGLVLRG